MTIPKSIIERKGARKLADVPLKVVELLNTGIIESVNLMEWLAVDQRILLKNVMKELEMKDIELKDLGLKDIEFQRVAKEIIIELNENNINKTMKIIPFIGQKLLETFGGETTGSNKYIMDYFAGHRVDSVRCWAAYVIGLDSKRTIQDKLIRMQPFAADQHFCVREIAWMAMREPIIEHLPEALAVLEPWTGHSDENVRRFATEATRPQGVWCKHITGLKKNPEIARKILEPLQSDPSKYVQDSVGNWLNDASKTNPEWVSDLCSKWLNKSQTSHTKRIVKKALRTIDKNQRVYKGK